MAKTTTLFDVAQPVVAANFPITVNELASGSGLTITTLPAGTVVDAVSIEAPAMGSGTGLSVGDADDTDRLFLDSDTAGATNTQMATASPTGTNGWIHQYDSATVIKLYNAGGSTTTASDLVVNVKIVAHIDFSGSNYDDVAT